MTGTRPGTAGARPGPQITAAVLVVAAALAVTAAGAYFAIAARAEQQHHAAAASSVQLATNPTYTVANPLDQDKLNITVELQRLDLTSQQLTAVMTLQVGKVLRSHICIQPTPNDIPVCNGPNAPPGSGPKITIPVFDSLTNEPVPVSVPFDPIYESPGQPRYTTFSVPISGTQEAYPADEYETALAIGSPQTLPGPFVANTGHSFIPASVHFVQSPLMLDHVVLIDRARVLHQGEDPNTSYDTGYLLRLRRSESFQRFLVLVCLTPIMLAGILLVMGLVVTIGPESQMTLLVGLLPSLLASYPSDWF